MEALRRAAPSTDGTADREQVLGDLVAVLVSTGSEDEARRLLEAARTGFEQLGNDAWAALAAAWKARAHLQSGERAQAELAPGEVGPGDVPAASSRAAPEAVA